MSERSRTEPDVPLRRPSELHQELLARARAAGHGPAALGAFAEALGGLDEPAAYEAVMLRPGVAAALDVEARLAAELDPYTSWRLNLGQAPDTDALGLPTRGSVRPRVVVGTEEDREVSITGGRRLASRDLGDSPAPSRSHAVGRALAEGPLSPSGRHVGPGAAGVLGVRHRRLSCGPDCDAARLVSLLVTALSSGLPVAAQLSGAGGSYRAVFLQARPAGRGHALQLHVPSTGETAWVNAQDVRDGAALPVAGGRLVALSELLLPERREGT
ncbi:MAG: hypothetical protein RL653_2618 [Pseudomonadota bacterium]